VQLHSAPEVLLQLTQPMALKVLPEACLEQEPAIFKF
jgi:hypothetical protein